MSEAKKPTSGSEPVTAGPWRGGTAAVIRVRWKALGTGDPCAETFGTMEEAEALKRELEAQGIEATIG